MNEAGLFQMITRLEEAFREGGTKGLQRFWIEQILKKPDVLKRLHRDCYLPFLIGKVRELIAPQEERDDPDHTISSRHYWGMQLASAIWCKMNGQGGNHSMRETDPHEQVMAELVRDTVEHIKVDED